MDKIPMTAAGYSVLETELKQRQQVERPRIIQAIADARARAQRLLTVPVEVLKMTAASLTE